MNQQIFVATVHWESGAWIKTQVSQLAKHLPTKPLIYAYLNRFETKEYEKYFDYFSTEDIKTHNYKLNALADKIITTATDNDIITFIDGDAFPVDDLSYYINILSKKTPLIAVQRLENLGDIQPHPCFCMTTVGFWKSINANWNPGYKWRNSEGKLVTDVGATVLKRLKMSKTDWLKLNRTNKVDLHPLWYGIYDDRIYHHGAGFRNAVSRVDHILLKKRRKHNKKFTYQYMLRRNNVHKEIISQTAIETPHLLNSLFLEGDEILLEEVNEKIKNEMNKQKMKNSENNLMEKKWGKQLIVKHTNFGKANYLKVLRNIHNKFDFKTYLEVGVRFGDSLKEAKNYCIGVDPNFRIKHNIMEHKTKLSLFQKDSDSFFNEDAKNCFADKKIDIAFLDGLHTSEQLFLDFINTEKYCKKNSIIILHDVLPRTLETTQRVKPTEINMWTGDVWKIIPYLLKHRKDLNFLFIDAPPSGLCLITNLNPEIDISDSEVLRMKEEVKNIEADMDSIVEYLKQVKIVDSQEFINTITKKRTLDFNHFTKRSIELVH